MKKLAIFAFAVVLYSCSATKQEVSPLVQKKYYKVLVQDADSSANIVESKIVQL